MRRRSLLTALTAGTVGLAGCSFRMTPKENDGSARPEPTTGEPATTTARDPSTVVDDPETTDPPSTGIEVERPPPPLMGSVAESDAGPRTLAFRPADATHVDRVHLDFGFVQRESDRPPHLGVVVRNVHDREIVVSTDSLPTIGRQVAVRMGADDRSHLAFVPALWNEVARYRPEIERGPEGYWRLTDADGGDLYPDSIRLAPDEGRRVDSVVVGLPETTGLPTGEYRVQNPDDPFELTVWHSERPGPTDPSRFGGRSMPALSDDESVSTTWFHEADPGTGAYVAPGAERTELPARLRFTAINNTPETLGCGHWRLYKLIDGAFYGLSAPLRTGECRQIRPGGRKTHRLLAFAGDPVRDDDPDEAVVGHLGGGTYAAVSGWATDADASGALVDLSAPRAEVRPTDDVTAERDGSTVTVRYPGRTDLDSEPGVATLTPTDAADRRLIAEQVMQPRNRAVRNTLAHAGDDVDRVVLETTARVVERALRLDDDSDDVRFSFRGEAYELVAERSTED